MVDTIERCARASCDNLRGKGTWSWIDERVREEYREAARACLAALLPVSERIADAAFYLAVDQTVEIDGEPVPAGATLIYRVCGNDAARFEEAIRLIPLFITAAITAVLEGKA